VTLPAEKQLAWGGIAFSVPADWEPRRVAVNHLLLESRGAPIMEIKWGAGGGRPLRRLARRVRGEGGAFRERPLPADWQAALAGLEGAAFEWEAAGRHAVGACVRCRECGTVSLVQFLDRGSTPEHERRRVRVLASLSDHRRDGRVRWQLFDIAAELPAGLRLAASRFHPGRFEMSFRRGRTALTLWRFAPAEALLQGTTLADFTRAALAAAGLDFEPATVNGFAGAAATVRPAGTAARLAARLGLIRRRAVRVWHVPASNRILAAELQGPPRGLDVELDAICRDYGVDAPIST
jgi:hypothetical protein